MTSRRIVHCFVPPAGFALALALIFSGCFPTLSGAPCISDLNCLEGQVCVAGRCALVGGETGGDGGRVPGDAGGGSGGGAGHDAGTGGGKGDGGSKDAGTAVDAGSAFDGGSGEGGRGTCYDGLDNDGDGKVDCADTDCGGQACRPSAGECDLPEVCATNSTICPSDRVAQPGTKCGPAPGCTDGVVQPQSSCNANGSCTLAVTTSCNGFGCNGGGCRTQCNADTDCDSTHWCQAVIGTCEKKFDLGGNCQAADQCGSGRCAGNICCNSECLADCDVCTAASGGICSHAPAGSDPKGACGNGTCGGAEACTNVCSGSVCGNIGCNKNALCIGGQCSPLKTETGSCKDSCECSSMTCTQFYQDMDGDGYGDVNAMPIGFCGSRFGYVTNNLDTCDADPMVNPRVATYFGAPNKCGTFDWNSNGTIELELSEYSCRTVCISGIAPGTPCGGRGYLQTCTGIGCAFSTGTTFRVQACH